MALDLTPRPGVEPPAPVGTVGPATGAVEPAPIGAPPVPVVRRASIGPLPVPPAPAAPHRPGPASPGPFPAPPGPAGREDAEAVDGNAVRSVDRAASLLLELGECEGQVGVTELARRLGLHKSTASRLLATLQRRGLVDQDEETGKYRLGLVVIRLADRAERTLDLRSIAAPDLERLARTTRETVSLSVVDGGACLTAAQADGPNLVAVPDWTGRSTPLHCTASGKVLMAAMAERDVLRIARPGLQARTERTITRLEPLMEELAKVRRRGFATAFSEWIAGTNAVAVPVVDARGRVVASVAVWGPAFRIAPARVGELVGQARQCAAAITTRLGGVPS